MLSCAKEVQLKQSCILLKDNLSMRCISGCLEIGFHGIDLLVIYK